MRATSQHMKDMLAAQVSTLATCWRLERTDGQVYRWTDHDESLTVDSEVYEGSWSGGFDKSAIESRIGLGPTDLEVVGFLGSGISRRDIEAGLFDAAQVRVFLVDWTNPDAGVVDLRTGVLGEAVVADQHTYKVEIRGLQAPFTQTVGEVYSPECRANFGDKRCGLDTQDYTIEAEVDALLTLRSFTFIQTSLPPAEPPPMPVDAWQFGVVRFTTGDNAGVTLEVKSIDTGTGTVELKFPMPHPAQAGDEFELLAGCDQRLKTCQAYENVINFRGEPHVPGSAKIFQNLAVRR